MKKVIGFSMSMKKICSVVRYFERKSTEDKYVTNKMEKV